MAKVTLDKNGLAKAEGTLTVYGYDALTGEFTGAVQEFLPQGVGLPACACLSAPPAAQSGMVSVYQDGSWLSVPDHRGETVYPVSGGAPVKITALGDYPADTTTQAPATTFDKWDGEKWVTDTDAQQQSLLDAAASEKSARVSEANGITQAWQTQLLLGIITDADKALLTSWMKYIQAVQAADITNAPKISWPVKPE
ncbi:tail fiber assembly protein [Pantoea sp. Bo_2]|uniref:tail fiber assembly protein n=1 Tax=unclassified Pantoea TaxID=2630326 RepID=UPI0012322099|nr:MULTISPECIES: tail fiber assembly protein [unclassified Pantoea]KAA5943999.1 tail fiber assembly protein [Pantoea sp. VH_3]KAA5951576.1 tail fiber assembly protein [Pantoea sp. VH_25]KAA5981570.1 tail fiber assembly protein [Pantoea sp. M_3]KAA6044576.1 tail fiber assembly protein [Pantoea sp. FN_2b]KAA6049001.1 tail fiber assembly protein [Pantoea sp. Bo_5]